MKIYVNWDEQLVYNQEDYNDEIEEITAAYVGSSDMFNQFVKEETTLSPHDILQFEEHDKDELLKAFNIYCKDLATEKVENDFEEFDIE